MKERKKVSGSRKTQSFKVKRNWFERLFIVVQKLGTGIRPLKFPESSTAVGFSSNRWTWETKELPKLNEGTPWALKSQGWVTRRQTCNCCDLTQWNQIIRQIRRGNQNPPFLLRSRKARFWGAIVGANWSHMFKLHWKRLGPISSLICIDCIRKGRTQYPVRG